MVLPRGGEETLHRSHAWFAGGDGNSGAFSREQRRRPNPWRIRFEPYWYPPKWGINEAVAAGSVGTGESQCIALGRSADRRRK